MDKYFHYLIDYKQLYSTFIVQPRVIEICVENLNVIFELQQIDMENVILGTLQTFELSHKILRQRSVTMPGNSISINRVRSQGH